MNALSKINQNVHFVVIINNLQNYHNYAKANNKIETLFDVAFIPDEDQTLNDTVLSDIR